MAAQYGVDAGTVLGKPLASLHQHFWLDPGDGEAAFRSLAQHGSWHGQNIHRRHDGRQLHVDVTVTVLKGDDGEPLGLVAIIRDVTAQKQLAAALHEMEELHDLALEGGQLGTWAVDLETHALQWGARCRQFFGLGSDEPANLEKSFAIIHPEDRPRAEAAFAAAADPASVGRYAVEKRIVRPDGTMRWVAYYARAGRRQPLELVRTGELLDMPRGFRVQVEGELPTLVCARRPLEIVLYHLIENAAKHHDRPQQGTAIISVRMQGDYVEFRVCDDGPGIAPQYHGRIFDIFQTLRPRDEVEGSGRTGRRRRAADGDLGARGAAGGRETRARRVPCRAGQAVHPAQWGVPAN